MDKICCGKEPQYLIQKYGIFYLSEICNIWEAAMFTDKEEAKYSYSLFKRLDMWLCRIMKNIEEYLATHKLLVFTFSLSVLNFLCYSISEDYSSKGNVKFYWIIALAVLVGIMIGSKAINTPYIKTERLHEKIIESKQPYWFEKKWIKIVSSCCGIISLVISLIILSVYCPKKNLEIDYLGAIVAVLSLAVAIFVAVQIYQSFNLKRDIDEQNKKLLERVDEKNRNFISELRNENKELRNTLSESNRRVNTLENQLGNLKSDLTFTMILNYAREMNFNTSFQVYAIDAYMDALNVAVTDKLGIDRVNVVIASLIEIFHKPNNVRTSILPMKRSLYLDILSKVEPKNNNIHFLSNLIFRNSRDADSTAFPDGHIRIMSDYNPDLLNAKPNNKPIVEK